MVQSTEPLAGSDVGEAAYAEIHDRLLMATVFLYSLEPRQPRFCGTATCVSMAGARFILTASHVLDQVGGPNFAVATRPDIGLATVSKTYMSIKSLNSSGYGQWGPDLAICRIPEPIASQLLPDGKVYHRLDAAPMSANDNIRWFWVLVGVPDEMSIHGASEDVLATRAIGCHTLLLHEHGGHKYVDLLFDRTKYHGLPRSFGGVSGGGLWIAEFETKDDSLNWTGRVCLRGVAFYQHPEADNVAAVRCHDREDIVALLTKSS
jgi:hypothetical protein